MKDNKSQYENWYVGLVGFLCSYNSKWFAGYANNIQTKDGIRNYAEEGIRGLKRQSEYLQNITFKWCDFRDIKEIENFVIYCDIPYRNTTKYATEDFPYDEFYSWCKKMARNNIVLISEYTMPKEFECIWTKKVTTSLDNRRGIDNDKSNRIEKLFICK